MGLRWPLARDNAILQNHTASTTTIVYSMMFHKSIWLLIIPLRGVFARILCFVVTYKGILLFPDTFYNILLTRKTQSRKVLRKIHDSI